MKSNRDERPEGSDSPQEMPNPGEPDALKGASTVVRPGKADVFSRSQTCRGKNRKPRSWEGSPEGNRWC